MTMTAPADPTVETVSPVQLVADDQAALRHDHPVRLPASRGPVSEALLRLLDRRPDAPITDIGQDVERDLVWRGPLERASSDEDLQLALWLVYELHYRGLAGVDDDWEWQPGLAVHRQQWEQSFLGCLRQQVSARFGATPAARTPAAVVAELETLAGGEDGTSVSTWLMKHASREQFEEFLVHRSIYHLKEADPHTWAIPRLAGAVKAAMITIQSDEYGLGRIDDMHAQLFRAVMIDWALNAEYGRYLDHVPAVTLVGSNLVSMFGLHRRWRGALLGHLALFEMTSSTPNGRYARGHRRLGGGEEAARFFDEHVVADSVHEQIAAHDLAAGLARTEPALAPDIVFGAHCAAVVDQLAADHLLSRWRSGRSSLRRPIEAW